MPAVVESKLHDIDSVGKRLDGMIPAGGLDVIYLGASGGIDLYSGEGQLRADRDVAMGGAYVHSCVMLDIAD